MTYVYVQKEIGYLNGLQGGHKLEEIAWGVKRMPVFDEAERLDTPQFCLDSLELRHILIRIVFLVFYDIERGDIPAGEDKFHQFEGPRERSELRHRIGAQQSLDILVAVSTPVEAFKRQRHIGVKDFHHEIVRIKVHIGRDQRFQLE